MSITSESWWGRELVPLQLNATFRKLCDFFKSDPMGGGTKGNAAHTYGRHRSFEWCRNSAFCTDRAYGTTDKRDRDGGARYIRAMDVKLTPSQMRTVSHRLDEAVRAGRLPQVAEWFGTFNNSDVVGWYEGHPSSADDSHLEHVHVGVWTVYANDAAALDGVYAVMTGEDVALTDAEIGKIADATAKKVWTLDNVKEAPDAPKPPHEDPDSATNLNWAAKSYLRRTYESTDQGLINDEALDAKVDALVAKVDLILKALAGGPSLPPAGNNTSATFTGTVEFTQTPPVA